jgi:hypothetical protein
LNTNEDDTQEKQCCCFSGAHQKCFNKDKTFIGCEETIIENAFFKMWCFNEYTNDCYNTNKISHFQNILIEEGFKLTHVGKDIIFDKKKQIQMIKTTQENSIGDYEIFVELYKSEKKFRNLQYYFLVLF